MKNTIAHKLFASHTTAIFRVVLTMIALASFVGTSATAANNTTYGTSTGANTVICSIVNVFHSVQTAIFVLGLLLMILGGALYAGSHLMPGPSKGTMQGYGMGMVLGGVVGVIIAVIAPYILDVITGTSSGTFITNATTFAGCP